MPLFFGFFIFPNIESASKLYRECVAAARVRMNETCRSQTIDNPTPHHGKNVKSRIDEEPFDSESEGCKERKEKKIGPPYPPPKMWKRTNEATSRVVKEIGGGGGGMKSEDGDIKAQFYFGSMSVSLLRAPRYP